VKILVTGASGYIGSNLMPFMDFSKHEVIALTRDEVRMELVEKFPSIKWHRFDIAQGDTRQLLAQIGPVQKLIHLAWPYLNDFHDLRHVTEALPSHLNFLVNMINSGLQEIMITGTCLEYGLKSGLLNESMASNPSISYAIAKNVLRILINKIAVENGVKFKWARIFYSYGNGQNPNSLIPKLKAHISSEASHFYMSEGSQLRDYLEIKQMCLKLAQLLAIDFNGCVNICSGKPVSVRELVEKHIMKADSDIIPVFGKKEVPTYEPANFWGDTTLFDSLLNDSIKNED
jgi:dTDP-6-deoxy-L-talose 4-dehydrogenase (NAD+)